MDTGRYDAIVVGGGHNGLVAAAYLAKAGARTVVLEARHKTGGAADTMAPWPEAPEFKVTTLSYVMSLMPDTIQSDLELARHGYRSVPVGPYFLPFPDGRCIVQADDDAAVELRRVREVLQARRRRDRAVGRVDRRARGGARAVADDHPAAASGRCRLGDLQSSCSSCGGSAGWTCDGIADVTRLMTMSIMDILDRFFETDQVKTVMALNGLIGTWAGPYEPGTGYVMAHHSIGDVGDGHLGAWASPDGGMGAVSDAMESSARSFGAEIRMRTRGSRASSPPAAGSGASSCATARSSRRRSSSPRSTRRSRSCTSSTPSELPADFVARHRNVALAERHR